MAYGYKELAAELRAQIEQGAPAPGDTLPRQADLAEQYGVNVKTVRAAVALLEAEGLVTPVRRRGTVVRERPAMRRLGTERYSKSKWKFGDTVAFAADREASNLPWSPSDQTQTVELVDPPARVVAELELDAGERAYVRSRLVKLAGQPTHTLTSYYRQTDVEGTPLVDPAPGPAGRGGGFAVLTLQGLEPHEVTETISSRMPTPDETSQLEIPAGEPVMILERTVRTAQGHPVEFAVGVHRASQFSWQYTFEMPN
ncbi:GntR family transcriptional regulator [Brachybacterium sp. GCM10030267]|uniref:GntR family transcriptional regulator n=1 Tax=Brachybacterium sp. GCM10030267 TaxID=3273381 RepID=UPI00361E9F58